MRLMAKIEITAMAIFLLSSRASADALEYTVTTSDGGPPITSFVNGADLIGLTSHLIEHQDEFAAFLNRSYTAHVKYLGVQDALQLTSNATGTSVTVRIPRTGFTRTFTGATADDVRKQIEDFIKKN